MKSGNLNFLEPSGPLQAFNGTALPLPRIYTSPEFLVTFISCIRHDYTIFIIAYCRGNRQAMYEQRNIVARSRNHFSRGKQQATSITYSECVCCFSYPACKAQRQIILSSVVCPALQSLSTLPHKSYNLGEGGGGLLYIQLVWFYFLSNFCLKRFSP